MKHFKKLAMCALLMPAGALAAGTPSADEQPHDSATHSSQPAAETRGTPMPDRDRSAAQRGADSSTLPTPDRDRPDAARTGADRDRAAEALRETPRTPQAANFMANTPDNAIRVDNVIGKDLYMRSSDEEVGTISDLILDEDGQIVAVVVSVGGFFGIGDRDVAISWDSVERTMNEDRDGYKFSVNATEDSLRNAPEYDKDSTGISAVGSTQQ